MVSMFQKAGTVKQIRGAQVPDGDMGTSTGESQAWNSWPHSGFQSLDWKPIFWARLAPGTQNRSQKDWA